MTSTPFPSSGREKLNQPWASQLLTLVLYLAALAVFAVIIVNTCFNKPFWTDEGYDIKMIAGTNWINLLLGQTAHPNNNPLYYVIQKINLSLNYPLNSTILITYRLVSIIAGAGVIVLTMRFIQRHFGAFWAIFIFLTTINQTLFLHYAAESRHYMLWVLCFIGLVFATVQLCLEPFDKTSPKAKCFFAGACLAMALVISMGFIQIFFAVLGCLILYFFSDFSPQARKTAMTLVVIFIVCFVIGLLYSFQKPQVYFSTTLSELDLLGQIEKGDYSLLKMPFRILLPKPDRDAYFLTWLNNFLVLVGLGPAIFYWSQRRVLKGREKILFLLSYTIIFQLLATLVIAAVVAYCHFYFVQKLFLHLTICHALLSCMGAIILWQLLIDKVINNSSGLLNLRSSLKYAVAGVIIFMVGLTWNWQRSFYHARQRLFPADAQCQMINSKLPEQLQLPSLYNHRELNFIVALSYAVSDCNWHQQLAAKELYVWRNAKEEWHLSQSVPENGQVHRFFNKDFRL